LLTTSRPWSADTGDFYGSALALSADALVVGSSGEDGAATGVDGDQSNNAATVSGAAYLLW
jgi:hypothetical protein